MKRDSDIIRDVLVWLLQDPAPLSLASSITPESVSPPAAPGVDPCATIDDSSDAIGWDYLTSEAMEMSELEPLNADFGFSDPANPVNRLGDIPAVQDRFQTLLKRRLRLEIERHPPLFPWEQGDQDYSDWMANDAAEPALWLQQLRQLKLPTRLPDEVLATLLDQCQTVLQQSMQTGIRLIRAVEPLFPGQPQTLDQMARLVLTSASRGSQDSLSLDYDTANPQQQVALTMMAAQTIFSSLTLEVSLEEPRVRRQWLTTLGTLSLDVDYQSSANRLEVRCTLPTEGYLNLSNGSQTQRSERRQPGSASLLLADPTPNSPYCLEVGIGTAAPLQFLLTLTAAPVA